MNPSQSQLQKEQQEQRNLLAQQSEIESLQCIFDRQLEILVDNCQALQSSSSMTSDEEKKNDENDEKSYEFQILIPPTNDEDSKVFDMIVNRFENDDKVDDENDKVDDFDANAIQNFDILQLRYHVRDLGYRIVFALNAQYPSSAIPHSIRVQNLNLRGGEWNESLIQRILSLDEQNSGNHDAENELVHRDLRQMLRFKVTINERERQSMQAFLEEHAREWLENVTAARNSGSSSGGSDTVLVDNEEPMIYYLINLLRDFVDSGGGGGGGDSELDRLMSEYKSSGTSPSSSSPISIGYEGPLPLKRNDYSKKKQFNNGRNSGGDENFSHIYKYAFRDVSKKGAPASNQYLSLTPYLILNKFSQSKVATPSRFRRSLQMTCQSKYNFVIAYGGIDVRNQVLTSQVRYLSKDCLTATSIRTFGDTPTNRVLATLTALEDHPTDKFLLIGGMSSMQSMLNDIFLLEILDPITNKGLNLNDMTLDTIGVKWRCIAMTPTGLCGHSACYYRKKRGVWVFGGLTPRGYSNKLMYVTDNGKVKELETRGAPRPRSGHAMSKEIEESIFVFGGHDDQGVFNDLHMLNTDTLMWTSIVVLGPSPNLTHCSGRTLIPHLDNTFIIHGGFNGKKWTNDTYIFDTHEKRWRICFVPKEQAVQHSQPVFNALEATQDNILVMGGESEDMYRSNLNYLNYGSFVEHTLKSIIPKSVESPPTINYKHNSHMSIQYRDSTLGKLSKVRFNWFEEQDEENCDVVLIFEDDQTDQYVNLCCHKLILQQCPKLVQLILKAERNEGTNLQHGVRTNIRMSAQQGLGTYTAHEWKTVCQYLYSGMIALNDSVRQDKHLSKVKSLAKTLQIQALYDLLSGTVSFSTILNENMPLISEQLSRSFLKPKLLSPEEHARILHEVEMEQMLTMESVDFSSIAADEHGTNGQTVIDESNYMKNGLVKLIARNNGSQSELDQYMCIVCHKGILLHHSLYFKTVFNSQFSESVSGIARIDQLSIQALEALCNYMYTGFLPEIETSQILELYIVSHQFIMEELGPWLRYLIRQHIDVNIACAICDISEKLSDEIMRKFCISYIAKHLDTIMDPNMKEDESDQYMFDTFRDLSSRTRIDIRTAYFNNLKAKQKIEKRASNKLNK